MALLLDPDRDVTTFTCEHGDLHERICGFINDDERGAFAIYFANCVHHDGVHEAYIDVILDNDWDPDHPTSPSPDRVTFGCRYGWIENHGLACSLVQGGSAGPNVDYYGHKLSRDEALAHPWLARFWEAVDLIIEHDSTVRGHFTDDDAE